ncbi:MAG: M23 family metallopeptidase [Deltaproteobacteria bacterium]|nr:M23 family metallopeptidase [Deltaproteobacteria bacterium]
MTTLKKIILLAIPLAFCTFLALGSIPSTDRQSDLTSANAIASVPPEPPAQENNKTNQDSFHTMVEGELRSGDTLSRSLARYSIDPLVRQLILDNLSTCLDFKRLRPKDKYRVYLDDEGQLLRCEYESSPMESYSITRMADTFVAEKDTIDVDVNTCMIEGVISTSLFEAFSQQQLQPALIYAFADIFSSRMDFNTQTQKDDSFLIVFEKYYKDDQFIGYGNILYARYQQCSGEMYEGYFYRSEEKAGSFYDTEGRELGTSFIKSPVPLGKVTSNFNLRRIHPISGIIRPHLGVDFAAPAGTPVMATADGKVSFAGFQGGFGRQIVLTHAGGYKTYYGHLSRFSEDLQCGSAVNQKQVIGYVGSSGFSTGPHLDYRLQQHDKFYDPFSMEFQPKSVLQGEELARFQNDINVLTRLVGSTSLPGTLYVRHLVIEPDEQLTLL